MRVEGPVARARAAASTAYAPCAFRVRVRVRVRVKVSADRVCAVCAEAIGSGGETKDAEQAATL